MLLLLSVYFPGYVATILRSPELFIYILYAGLVSVLSYSVYKVHGPSSGYIIGIRRYSLFGYAKLKLKSGCHGGQKTTEFLGSIENGNIYYLFWSASRIFLIVNSPNLLSI